LLSNCSSLSRWIIFFLFLFLHDSDHKMSVVNSCVTMQKLVLLLSFSCVLVSVVNGEWE
jgi:hypothetical protein